MAKSRWLRLTPIALVAGAVGVALAASSCASLRDGIADPVGRPFPAVQSKTLDGKVVRAPEDFAGKPLVAILATDQDAQFDIDRWLLGLLDMKTPAAIREFPTIAGFVPGLLSGRIDGGMRNGIPEEDWGSVVTFYGADAERLVEFFGNRNPRNGRIVLVGPDGHIRWIHDRGYSARVARELDAAVRAMR